VEKKLEETKKKLEETKIEISLKEFAELMGRMTGIFLYYYLKKEAGNVSTSKQTQG